MEGIIFQVAKIKNLDRISIKRKGLVGVLHFHARNMKRLKRTGTWRPDELKQAEQVARIARDKHFPQYKGGG